jgi:hypothetical protein
VIGTKGAEVGQAPRRSSEDMIKRKVAPVKVIEIKKPRPQRPARRRGRRRAAKKRASFRRVLKMRMTRSMQAGAKGIKISVSGRLGGAEIARQEKAGQGSVPADHTPGRHQLRPTPLPTRPSARSASRCGSTAACTCEEVLETDACGRAGRCGADAGTTAIGLRITHYVLRTS